MDSYIHHIEWCVKDLEQTAACLISKYGFSLISERHLDSNHLQNTTKDNSFVSQKVVQSGAIYFLLTQNNSDHNINNKDVQTNEFYPVLTCCSSKQEHRRNTVFNICLEVKNVEKATNRAIQNNINFDEESTIITPPTTIEYGKECRLQYSVIKSICGNIIHTLINTKEYRRHSEDVPFLPGFNDVHRNGNKVTHLQSPNQHLSNNINYPLTSFIDHVTYVCRMGESKLIINWYKHCFGMERFLIGSEEEIDDDGIEIGEEVGMRLTVGEWISSWMCREEGVQFEPSPCRNQRLNFKLVLAEPLKGYRFSHVQQFIDEHGGPGIQHIGLTAEENITNVVQIMHQCGAEFRKPPPAYYTLDYKKEEILGANENILQFERLGLLLDAEVDFCDDYNKIPKQKPKNILIQIFTKPLFDENTFFLEILERRGARGFGAGNITALAKSILLQQKQ